ncbi:putative intracellular septation protein A [Algimonas ampicilliniresistens]|uniref:Inner membrane-spanning protein YciB n=1 Tax=Algimonas ampicilliniresistens TaxID=1298735 RepID=A0ABQ5VBS7_9PROT|nr:inner membrane-spanning protein YciB [Algimonas ampicilliniresistens]GLQ24140.1 putative intracellular septation protein A [Algimonas ampicilliniresistens]
MSDDNKVSLDTIETANISSVPEGRGAHNSFWLDFGPLLVFFVSFHWIKRSNPDDAMLIAAGIFAVAAVIALAIGWLRHKKVSGMLVLSTAIIVVTAALALLADNKVIFYMKPTIVNALFGIAAIGGVLIGRNIIRLMIGSAFTLPDRIWDKLAIRWGLFFFAMAALNEFVWRTQSEDFWVNFKVFGFLPLTIIFTLTMIPLINRHGGLQGLEKSKSD